MVITEYISISSKGNTDIIDITSRCAKIIEKSDTKNGIITIFVTGSTGSVTTIEYEPNLTEDLKAAFERLIPSGINYEHAKTWGDHNGHSHIRASLMGPSLQIPFAGRQLRLGTWQQIVFIDFDAVSRQRRLTVQVMGE